MKMEQTECSETSADKIPTPGNYPEENIQHTEYEGKFEIAYYFPFHENFGIPTKSCTEHSKGNRTVPGKVATTRTEDGHKQNTKTSVTI